MASAGVREGLAREGISQEQVPLLLQQARWLPTYPPLASSAV